MLSAIGDDLLLETITASGEQTTVYVEWASFEHAEYLDDVGILIETINTTKQSGTTLTIEGNTELLLEWDQKQFDKLLFELKKLKSPLSISHSNQNSVDDFAIYLSIENFPNVRDMYEIIEPYPIFDLFDYRISGEINAEGKGVLRYSSQKARNMIEERIHFDLHQHTGCGVLVFDIRVYDREKDAIESLIARGLKDEANNYVGSLQARRLLNEYNGIGVYRNGFRIRPLGDADFDWLKLNEQRIQNPSLRIGSNQVIGSVQIQSDEMSGLVEKSARDGLKENIAFSRLKEITKAVIAKLEERRFDYRRKTGLSRPVLKVERELEQLFSYDELRRDIQKTLIRGGIDNNTSEEIFRLIDRDAANKNKVADNLRQAVAIYQGQATLGKIINVILHEGRRPLSYFRNQIPNLRYWYNSFLKNRDVDILEKIIPIINGLGDNADIFVNLFNKLDPLAAGKRPAKKPLDIKKAITDSVQVFMEKMQEQNVKVEIIGSENFQFSCWIQDIYAIFTNLIDNSLYWMDENRESIRRITIEIVTDGDMLEYIDYKDTGPGIEPHLIESEVIFEPQFSTKTNTSSTGLGLAIAGEAASRNGLELKAFETKKGAWFRLQPKDLENNI